MFGSAFCWIRLLERWVRGWSNRKSPWKSQTFLEIWRLVLSELTGKRTVVSCHGNSNAFPLYIFPLNVLPRDFFLFSPRVFDFLAWFIRVFAMSLCFFFFVVWNSGKFFVWFSPCYHFVLYLFLFLFSVQVISIWIGAPFFTSLLN